MNKAEQKAFTNKVGSALANQQQIVKNLEPLKNNPSVTADYLMAVGREEALMAVWQSLAMGNSIELNLLQG